ncbi:MAG: hypothetical protein ACOYB3_17975, partial [Azonexus sp.]
MHFSLRVGGGAWQPNLLPVRRAHYKSVVANEKTGCYGQQAWNGKNRANRLAVLPGAEKSP